MGYVGIIGIVVLYGIERRKATAYALLTRFINNDKQYYGQISGSVLLLFFLFREVFDTVRDRCVRGRLQLGSGMGLFRSWYQVYCQAYRVGQDNIYPRCFVSVPFFILLIDSFYKRNTLRLQYCSSNCGVKTFSCSVLLGGINNISSPRRFTVLFVFAPLFLATSHSLIGCYFISKTRRFGSLFVRYRRSDLYIGQGSPSNDLITFGLIDKFLYQQSRTFSILQVKKKMRCV